MPCSLHRNGRGRRFLSLLERFLIEAKDWDAISLYDRLHWPDLTRLSAASRLLHHLVRSYKETIWNIDIFAAEWFDNPIEFRAILALTGALVAGSQVVQFFDGHQPLNGTPLDVVTRVGGVPGFIVFLEEEGYEKVPVGGEVNSDAESTMASAFAMSSTIQFQERGRINGIVDVLEYVKPRIPGRYAEVVRIQIIVVTQNPVEHILMNYHSTGVMNFFSHSEAVSFFPATTFLSRLFLPSSRADLGYEWNPPWKWKYERRGFQVDAERVHPGLRLGLRTVKDKYSWVIPFNVSPRRIKEEEERSIYGPSGIDTYQVDLTWIAEDTYGLKRWHLAIYEPYVFWYLAPLYVRSSSS
ncbi:hypothetical protein FA13DRAFT_1819394 [Coprinellus micaceus]|uniref:Uncharacterized protein n=1 Tax=Coprinellus micaceus TaxID=71717 RepID=A0A4Y7SIC1_COPMI|nr:hypothetical protein FA13DRAFT_1819394 [Coprinellus micaceus]